MKIACLLLAITGAISCQYGAREHQPASIHQKIDHVVYMFPKNRKNWTAVQHSLQHAYSAQRDFDPFADDEKRVTKAVAMRQALASVGVTLNDTDEVLVFLDTGFISIKARREPLARVDKILIRVLVIPPEPQANGQ